MTFPLAGDLADPWIDGENPNAATMKSRITDKLNALATALGAKTARVSAVCSTSSVALFASGSGPVAIPVASIASSTGGTFSIVGGQLVLPANGIYAIRAIVQWSAPLGAYRNFMDIGTGTVPFALTGVRQRVGGVMGESVIVMVGTHTVTGASDNKIGLEGYHEAGVARAIAAGISNLEVVKISE